MHSWEIQKARKKRIKQNNEFGWIYFILLLLPLLTLIFN